MDVLFGILVNFMMYVLAFVIGRTVDSLTSSWITIVVLGIIIILSILVNIRLASRYQKKFKDMTIQGVSSFVISLLAYVIMTQVLVTKVIDPVYIITILPVHFVAVLLCVYVVKPSISDRKSFWGRIQR